MKIFIHNPIDDNFEFEGHSISSLTYKDLFNKKPGLMDYFKGVAIHIAICQQNFQILII